MKLFFRAFTIVLVIFSLLTLPTFAVTSARFGSNQYCKVTISQKLMASKKYKTASVKLNTYNTFGKKSSGDINVTLTDGNGKYIGTYKKKGGATIKLGNDHSSYRIYISACEKAEGGLIETIIARSYNSRNRYECCTWQVTNNKDCTIK